MLKIIELFAGIGSQTQALKNIGIKHEVVGISEINKYSLISYEVLHGKTHNFGDICEIEKLPKADLWTYSFPCLSGDTLVMTNRGIKELINIKDSDEVLTHTNSYKRVIKCMYTGDKEVYSIKGMGIDEIKATGNHKFYVRRKHRKGHISMRVFEDPIWCETENLNKNYYLGIATNQESKFPNWNGVDYIWNDGRKKRHKNNIKDLFHNHSFWWLVGRYLGDGWIRSQGGIIICCGKKEMLEIAVHIRSCGYNYSISDEKTTYKFHIADKELSAYLEQFGKGALNKTLTNDIIDLPRDYLKSFIEGYASADGCIKNDKYISINSISKKLIYSVAQCIAKAYQRPYSIHKTLVSKKKQLEGRIINQHDSYELIFKLNKNKQDKAFYEKGYIWFPITSVEKSGIQRVYDLEIESDHSFTANGVIVHNCQDISIAGKLAGINEETRSGLLYQVERLLRVANSENTLPKYLLLENVKNLVSKRFIGDFNKWLEFLETLGYKNYYKILNAKDYGIPQNRERVFCVSIRGDHSPFTFPKAIPLELKLKDMLEDEVDEKYYLSQKLLSCFLSDGTKGYPRRERFLGNINKIENKGVAVTVTTLAGSRPTDNFVVERLLKEELCDELLDKGLVKDGDVINHSYSNSRMKKPGVANSENHDCSPTLTTRGDTLGVVVKDALPIKNATKKGYLLAEDGDAVDISGRMEYHRGTVQKGITQTIKTTPDVGVVVAAAQRGRSDGQRLEISEREYANAITTVNKDLLIKKELRIRKLTSRECLRLMGWKDNQIDKIQESGVSMSQQYKQAGNGIVVNVLEAIFKKLFKGEE